MKNPVLYTLKQYNVWSVTLDCHITECLLRTNMQHNSLKSDTFLTNLNKERERETVFCNKED